MSDFRFEIIHQSTKSRARVGKIHTPHGVINTPNFVAVGTNGTLKALENTLLPDLGLQLMFCNTYHLLLQPGTEIIKQAGGLHKFINRTQPIITDSGGFQVFSLAYGSVADELKSRGTKKQGGSVLKITEEGVLFRSYRDGQKVLLTPESSVQAQKALGADIIIPLDELPPYHISKGDLKKSLDRTHRWERRSLLEHQRDKKRQAMYAVIHGGVDLDMRKESCDTLCALDFDGYAIGGSLGKTKDEMHEMLLQTMPHIPTEKPNHLLGIGDLASIDRSVPLGIDTFDSSYPTRSARHGILLTADGDLKISKSKNSTDLGPVTKDCSCPTCTNFSLAYLHHLFKAKEFTFMSLATAHNVFYMTTLMGKYRKKILENEM